MSIVSEYTLNFNRNIKINFDGGNLSSDSGLFIFKEFMEKIGFDTVLDEFKTNDTATFRIHKDASILKQVIYQIIAGYFPDDCSDKLRNDPVFCAVLNKGVLASQPSESRFFNRHYIRDFRNIIHPAKEKRMDEEVNHENVLTMWAVLKKLLNELY